MLGGVDGPSRVGPKPGEALPSQTALALLTGAFRVDEGVELAAGEHLMMAAVKLRGAPRALAPVRQGYEFGLQPGQRERAGFLGAG